MKNPSLHLFFTAAILLVQALHLQAQIKPIATLDTNRIKIGEQTRLKLTLELTAGSDIRWPSMPDTLGKIEILARLPIDTVKGKSGSLLKQEFVITAFDTGYFAIPPFIFGDTTQNDAAPETQALLLQVTAVPVDTTQEIKDIKPPLLPPFSWKDLMPWILVVPLLVLAIFFLIRWFRKRNRKSFIPPPPAIIRKPHEIAMEQLHVLESEKLWQNGNYKQYHIRITDIVREYIEKRYMTRALEQTTDEILDSLRHAITLPDVREDLARLLRQADLVKFAKDIPVASENEMAMNLSRKFIMATAPAEKGKEDAS